MYNSQTLGVYVCFLLLFPLYYSSPLVSCSFSPSVISSVSWFFSLVYFVPLRLLTSSPFCCLRPGSLSQWAIFKDDSIPRMHLEESETGREVSLIEEVWARMNKCVHASEVQGTKMPVEEKNWLRTNWKLKRKVSVCAIISSSFSLFSQLQSRAVHLH